MTTEITGRYVCPVCGYDRLRRPAENFVICPCCGTEFGYSDDSTDHKTLRKIWLAEGARWFSNVTRPPEGWNAADQVASLAKEDSL